MGRTAVLTVLLCPLMLSAAGMIDEPAENSAAIFAPAPGMALAAPVIPYARPAVDRGEHLWRWSAVALAASSGFDAASSYGKYESNHFLQSPNGTFGARGIMLKTSLVGASLAVEQILRRRYGHSKAFAIANFVQAGVTSGIAARNLSIPQKK